MKNLFKSIAALALVATIFTSCSKDGSDTQTVDPGAPSLTVTAPTADLNLRFKDVVTISFTSSPASGAKLKSVLLTRTNLTSNIMVKLYGDSSTIADSSSITKSVSDSVLSTNGNVNDKFAYTVIITDNKGKTATKTINVTVKDLYATGQFTLGAQSNSNKGIQEFKFFGLDENAPNSINLFKAGIPILPDMPTTADSALRARYNSSKIDMGVYYGTANLTTIFSPSLTGTDVAPWSTELGFWTTRNKTYFIRTNIQASLFSGTNFTVEQEIDKLDFTIPANQNELAKSLIKDNVIGFKTASGAKGLILVATTANGATSFVVLDIKWKK